jgi:hypothetical protein
MHFLCNFRFVEFNKCEAHLKLHCIHSFYKYNNQSIFNLAEKITTRTQYIDFSIILRGIACLDINILYGVKKKKVSRHVSTIKFQEKSMVP